MTVTGQMTSKVGEKCGLRQRAEHRADSSVWTAASLSSVVRCRKDSFPSGDPVKLLHDGDVVKTLPLEQKLQIMEAIWEDLRDQFEQAELPPRLKALLDQRRARVREGSSKLLDWNAVKSSVGRA